MNKRYRPECAVAALALDQTPEPRSAWDDPVFTCTYDLERGPLVLSVHDAADPDVGRDYFEELRAQLGDTASLDGMFGLGLPAYETGDGTAVFLKDGKTLQVDATGLPSRLGPVGSLSRSDLAYAIASSVVACWTEHAG